MRDENFITRLDFWKRWKGSQGESSYIRPELLPDLVFRESEYYDTIANPTWLVNYVPQSYFRSLNVLFVGTSLIDLNVRRWLYRSFRERVDDRTKYLQELYAREYKDAEFEAELESVRHFWLRTKTDERADDAVKMINSACELLRTQRGEFRGAIEQLEQLHKVLHETKPQQRELPIELQKMFELVMKKLGVQVVWFDGRREIADFLQSLKTKSDEQHFRRASETSLVGRLFRRLRLSQWRRPGTNESESKIPSDSSDSRTSRHSNLTAGGGRHADA